MADTATEEQVPQDTATPDFSNFWQQQASEAQSGGNTFFFPKAERTRFRLIGIGDDPREWFRKVESVYQGKTSDKYLIQGYEITDPKTQTEFALQCIVMPKTVWAGVCGMMAEGYDLFSPKGYAVVITRTNQSGRISYTTMPSPVAFPADEETWKEASAQTWGYFLTEYTKMQEGRAGNSGDSTSQGDSLADQIVSTPASSNEW